MHYLAAIHCIHNTHIALYYTWFSICFKLSRELIKIVYEINNFHTREIFICLTRGLSENVPHFLYSVYTEKHIIYSERNFVTLDLQRNINTKSYSMEFRNAYINIYRPYINLRRMH